MGLGLRPYGTSGASRLPERTSIHDRSELLGLGHFEADLMSCWKGSQNVLFERQSPFVKAVRLSNKTAKATGGIQPFGKTFQGSFQKRDVG